MTHSIQFRRPEPAHGVSRMFVPAEASAAAQIRLLKRLGYTILEVSPAPVGQRALELSGREL